MSSAPVATPNSPALSDPELQKGAKALRENRPQVAEAILRRYLETHPDDVTAMTMLAEAVLRFEKNQEAADLLMRSLELAPDFIGARHNYVTVLLLQDKPQEAFAQIAELIRREPSNPGHHGLKAMAHVWTGDHAGAVAEYEIVLSYSPKHPAPWIALAHSLNTLGRTEASIVAYHNVITRFPRLGEPYWSLANLKTFRFADAEVEAMRALLALADLPVDSRAQIQFALGKALEDKHEYAASFELYKDGNALKRAMLNYNPEKTSVYVTNCKTLFTQKFFSGREGWGDETPDPIFIVGMPRSGSTLVEQILASHPAVEGTMEMRILPYLVAQTGVKGTPVVRWGHGHPALMTDSQAPYPENLRNLDSTGAQYLGREYLSRARIHRVLGRRFFIDKMPDNFAHIGLIQLILPKAKIIDVRRHPLPCCFSNFKHYFAVGKDFSYALNDLGRYYQDYITLMTHLDQVLPGKIHRVFYERMIGNPENEIRGLLDFLDLPFEEKCLRFYETERPVRTASAQQVRMPIYHNAQEQWQHYEEWLGPLKSALGPTIDAYPYDATTGQPKSRR